ncbi:MAG TPA: hypothetical protein PLW65_05660 [Pseudomonadota bacterium]|nr:hypothetical protein [Pseudomonadota bacterium]
MSSVATEQKPAQTTNQASPVSAPATTAGTGNGYTVKGKESQQGYGSGKWPEYQKWEAWGSGSGNRKGDLPDDKGKIANQTVTAPKVAQADLSKIPTTTLGQKKNEEGWGTYHDSAYGTNTTYGLKDQKPSVKIDPATGKPVVDIYSATAAAGIREQVGVRGQSTATGKHGSAQVVGDAYAGGELGADAYAKVNSKDGAVVGANASGKLGVGVSGDANLRSNKLKLDGVDKDLQAEAGVHGEAFLGVKGGIGGRAGIGPEFTGAEGSIGGFAGIEAKGDIHGSLGPVGGKLNGSLMAGFGAGLDGGIKYENGKFTIGGRGYAAFGYGGSVGGEVTIDVKQAAQLVQYAGKKIYNAADGDGDGKLTLNDPATHLASATKGGAKLLDRGVDGAISALDGDGDGKFSANDLRVRMNQAGQALGNAKDKVLEGGQHLLNKGKAALDRDGDGKLGFGDVKAGASQLKDTAVNTVNKVGETVTSGAKRLHDAADHDGDGKVDLSDVKAYLGDAGTGLLNGGKRIVDSVTKVGSQAKDFVKDKASQVGHAVHDTLDADGDGKLSVNDAKVVGQNAYKGLTDAGQAVKKHAQEVMHDVHDAVDVNGDGKVDSGDALAAGKKVAQTAKAVKDQAVNTFHRTVAFGTEQYEAAKQKAVQLGQVAHKTADRDGDGKLGWNDVTTGASQVKDAVVDRAKQVGNVIHNAADRDGDGKLGWNDVSAGAGQVKDVVVEKASAAYDAAKAQVTQAASTVREGFSSAASTVKGTWKKVGGFFGF